MPTKHIREDTWDKIEKIRIKGIIETKTDIKEKDILDLILRKGIEKIDEADIDKLTKKKNK
jgi:hypothetical protein